MSNNRYTMKLPRDLKDFFQEYLDENPGLGFKKVSQYALHILREKALELKKERKENK